MKNKKHYVIGDIHAEYKTLLRLVSKLPTDARLIFVGDLVNRGKHSKEVIEFVRKNAYAVVKGNHEAWYFTLHSQIFLEQYQYNIQDMWSYVGGVKVLQSYRLINRDSYNPFKFSPNQENITQLQKDLEWVKELPIYLELGNIEGYDLPIVITHASVGDYWNLQQNDPKMFEFACLNNRFRPSKDASIFNIYGHVPYPSVEIGDTFVNVDTGCGKSRVDAKLSAFCIETQEIVEEFVHSELLAV